MRSEIDPSRRAAISGLLGATAAVGLGGCVGVEADETATVVSAASGSTVGWADAIGTAASPLDLRTMASGAFRVVIAKGFYAPGDGGGGEFHWTTDTTSTDDAGTVIVGTATPRTGCWKRLAGCKTPSIGTSAVGPFFNVKWFGAKGDGTTSDRVAIQNAIDTCGAAGGGTVWFPPGQFVCDDSSGHGLSILFSNINLVGSGPGSSFLVKQCGTGDLFTIGDVRHLRFSKFGIQPQGGSNTLITSGACFNFAGGGIFNAIEDIYALHMWDFVVTSSDLGVEGHNLRINNVICDTHKRFGAWLFNAIDPAITNLWVFGAGPSQGACVVYDAGCDGLILTGAVCQDTQFGFRSQNSFPERTGPLAVNASKCIMDNAGVACWSLGSLSFSRFDGCMAATHEPGAIGVVIASDCCDLHWTNCRIVNCSREGVQINGARSISFIGGSVLGASKDGNGLADAISIGLTATCIKIMNLDIGRDPSGYFHGVPSSCISLFPGVRYFHLSGNNYIGCNPIFDASGCPLGERVLANSLFIPA